MHPRFQAVLPQLAADLQAAIAPMLTDRHFPALLNADQVAALQSATGLDEDALAFALLPLAAACARADLSHFNVGAIARGISGTGTSAAIWNFSAPLCSKPCTPNKAPSAMPGCAAKNPCGRLPLTILPAATADSL